MPSTVEEGRGAGEDGEGEGGIRKRRGGKEGQKEENTGNIAGLRI